MKNILALISCIFISVGCLLLPFALEAQVDPAKKGIELQPLEKGNLSNKPKTGNNNTNMPPPDGEGMDSDTTKTAQSAADTLGFGPHTTTFLRETDVLYSINRSYNPDTSLYLFHRYNAVELNDFMSQDLGNLGMATRPIFYDAPDMIGTRLGLSVFDHYMRTPEDVRYFRTLSPFTEIEFSQGGNGRSDLKVSFSRNVNSRFNVAMAYERRSANRLIGGLSRRNDPSLTGQAIELSTRYISKNKRYKLLTTLLFNDHSVTESGGLTADIEVPEGQSFLDSMVQLDDTRLGFKLSEAESRQIRRTAHFYQQYALNRRENIALFHVFDYSSQDNYFTDRNFSQNQGFYDSVYFDPANSSISQARFATWRVLDNKAGFKGKAGNFRYNTYMRYRIYDYGANFIVDSLQSAVRLAKGDPQVSLDTAVSIPLNNELFVGGALRYFLPNNGVAEISGEYMTEGAYRAEAYWRTGRLQLRYKRSHYLPSAVVRSFWGNHHRWQNEFENTTADRIEAAYGFNPLPYLSVSPFMQIDNVQNLVYFDSAQQAAQAKSSLQMFRIGTQAAAQYGYWNAKLKLMYNHREGEDVWRMPTLFTNLLITYDRMLFDSVMEAQFGVDFHYHSRYQANAYSPASNQFYLQNDERVGGFPLATLFFNFKVKRVLLSLRMWNVLQGVTAANFYDTPFYIAQPRAFEIRINWLFFD